MMSLWFLGGGVKEVFFPPDEMIRFDDEHICAIELVQPPPRYTKDPPSDASSDIFRAFSYPKRKKTVNNHRLAALREGTPLQDSLSFKSIDLPRWWFQIFSNVLGPTAAPVQFDKSVDKSVVSNVFLIFTPKIGEIIQLDYVRFFEWVETTNQFADSMAHL